MSVEPSVQCQGVGRKLMEAVVERSRSAQGVRLTQATYSTVSMALYASLGFDVKEPLLLMRGRLNDSIPSDVEVRPMRISDLEECGALCQQVHGFERTNELRDGLDVFTPTVALRAGRVVAYASAPGAWGLNHAVAAAEDDMRALLLGVGESLTDSMSFLLPIRQASLFRWCLECGLRVVRPMTLMAMGEYQEPLGCYITSAVF